MRRLFLLPLVAVVHLALLLPTLIVAPHTGGDNAAYLTLAHTLLEGGGYVESWDPAAPPHTKYPPVYPLLLAAAMALGAGSWVAFKALSAGAVVGTVLLAFLWARRRVGVWPALGIALLLALSEAFLWAGSWILSEPLFLLLTMGAIVALEGSDARSSPRPWLLALGGALAILALFTRTAGLPLVGAVGVAFLLQRRWRGAAAFGVAAAIPLLLWWIRGRGTRVGGYVSEFLLVDPYRPELGPVGVAGLGARAWENLVGYATVHIPGGLAGVRGGLVPLLGIALLVLAAIGWLRATRRRAGVAELFAPLYAVLILIWPAVWSGDRFALPLYPLLLVWGWEAIAAPWKGSVRATRVVGGIAALLFLIPAAGAWGGARLLATQCREAVARGGPWACYAPPVQDWVEAARWAGVVLPDGAVVFNRKPSLHYVVSGGVRSRIFPFDEDPAAFFQVAGAVGVRYLVLDRLDGVSARYALPAIEAHPGRFCSIMGWGDPEGGQTVLLGILPPAAWTAADAEWEATEQVTLPVCAPDYIRETPRAELPPTSGRIPLLP